MPIFSASEALCRLSWVIRRRGRVLFSSTRLVQWVVAQYYVWSVANDIKAEILAPRTANYRRE